MIGPKSPRVHAKRRAVEQDEEKEAHRVWVINARKQLELGHKGARPFLAGIRNVSRVPLECMFYAMLNVLQKPKSVTESGKVPIGPQADSPHEKTDKHEKRFVTGWMVRQHVSISRTDDNQEPEELRTLGEAGVKLLRNSMVVLG